MKFSMTIPVQYDTCFSPFRASEWRQGLSKIREGGFQAAELCISDYGSLDIREIRRELENCGLGCSTISTGQAAGREQLSLTGDREKMELARARLSEHIRAAEILECGVTIGLLRGAGEAGSLQDALERLAEGLEPVVREAEEKGVVLFLEALNRYESALLNTGKEILDFFAGYYRGCRNLKVLWDSFHANIEEASLEKSIDSLGSSLGHVHLADSNRLRPGLGRIDFSAVKGSLERISYGGYVSFECLNGPDEKTVWDDLCRFRREWEKPA